MSRRTIRRPAPFALNRRRLLQAAGLTAGGMFLPSLSRAQANDGPPRRLVIFFSELGFTRSEFEMRVPEFPVEGTQDFSFDLTGMTQGEFSPNLQPMWRHRQDLIALENLSAPVAILDHHGDAHAQGFCAQLTGHPARSTDGFTSHASRASVDQIIAADLRARDPLLTDLTSLSFAPTSGGSAPGEFGHWPFYRYGADGGAQKVPAEQDPVQAFDRIFGLSGDLTPRDIAQPSVLDILHQRYDAVSARLSSEDRVKMNAHRDMIADFQQRLATASSCPAPDIGTEPPLNGQAYSEYWPTLYPWRVDAFRQLLAMSMSCGMTRVATFNFKVQPPVMFGRSGDVHHDFSHPSDPNWVDDGAHDHWEAVAYMSEKTTWEMEQIARFVDDLTAIPEGNGSVFDSTVIYFLNEISHGGHGHRGYTGTIVAGSNTGLRRGQYQYFGNRWPTPLLAYEPEDPIGMPNNRLLVTLAQTMGMDTDTIGSPSYTGWIGSTQYEVDMRGIVPQLLL